MTTLIKNGTIVTADLNNKADVRFEGGVITEIEHSLPIDAQMLNQPARAPFATF